MPGRRRGERGHREYADIQVASYAVEISIHEIIGSVHGLHEEESLDADGMCDPSRDTVTGYVPRMWQRVGLTEPLIWRQYRQLARYAFGWIGDNTRVRERGERIRKLIHREYRGPVSGIIANVILGVDRAHRISKRAASRHDQRATIAAERGEHGAVQPECGSASFDNDVDHARASSRATAAAGAHSAAAAPSSSASGVTRRPARWQAASAMKAPSPAVTAVSM